MVQKNPIPNHLVCILNLVNNGISTNVMLTLPTSSGNISRISEPSFRASADPEQTTSYCSLFLLYPCFSLQSICLWLVHLYTPPPNVPPPEIRPYDQGLWKPIEPLVSNRAGYWTLISIGGYVRGGRVGWLAMICVVVELQQPENGGRMEEKKKHPRTWGGFGWWHWWCFECFFFLANLVKCNSES